MKDYHPKFSVISPYSGKKEVDIYISKYTDNDRLFVGLLYYDEEDENMYPYANLTVNLDTEPIPVFSAFLDINNAPWAIDFVEKNKLAISLGIVAKSGYCSYPLYQFNKEKLKELCPDDYKEYFE